MHQLSIFVHNVPTEPFSTFVGDGEDEEEHFWEWRRDGEDSKDEPRSHPKKKVPQPAKADNLPATTASGSFKRVLEPAKPNDVPAEAVAKSTMRVRHLLIKFEGSSNPVSRRTNQSTADVTADAAKKELQSYMDTIQAEGGTEQVFAKYAKERSDCGTFQSGGDLGSFALGEMQQQFEDGVQATAIGTMSPIVQTDSGYHIIFRIA